MEFVHDDGCGPHDDIDTVLRPHDPDVCRQVPSAAAQLRVRWAAFQSLRIRTRAYDRDVGRRLAAAVNSNALVGAVSRDHLVRGAVSSAFQGPQRLVGQFRTVGKTRLVQLGTQVVVVEHEPGPVNDAERLSDRPEYIGRIASLDDREPPGSSCLERQPGRRGERVPVLHDETELAAAGRIGPVLVELHRVDQLISRVPFALGAHDGDLIAVRDEGLALEPHPSVEGHRKVLDDDEDAAHQPIPSWLRTEATWPGRSPTSPVQRGEVMINATDTAPFITSTHFYSSLRSLLGHVFTTRSLYP